MEAIIFIGIQGSGKSTFYKEKYFNSHLRISLDLLNTRNKEAKLLDFCLEFQQRLVIDNTNPTKKERAKYIQKLKERKFKVVAIYFDTNLKIALARNELRIGKAKVAKVGILSTHKKMELPSFEEGFDEIYIFSAESSKLTQLKNEI
ncbi:AAA family ATPase [Bernardetia sp.]|uniref:AAA family ATPase n=1 Tax=Bernardetia sp. TaxID=1937974 RepID=UPI0025B9C472|nr:AAA family ATPase [Bernardetia sp.]